MKTNGNYRPIRIEAIIGDLLAGQLVQPRYPFPEIKITKRKDIPARYYYKELKRKQVGAY